MIVDMHCHILPGVDDGPKEMDETLKLLQEADRQGITHMIATSHHHPGRYMVDGATVLERLAEVQHRRRRFRVKLYPGQECYYYSDLVQELNAGHVLTLAGSDYVLVEFSTGVQYSTITHAVQELTMNGYIPILAHIERYACLNGRKERLDELHDGGAYLQMNFDRLLEKDTFFHPNPWRRLVKEGYIDYMGSDTHGMNFRPLHVQEAVEWMNREVDRELRMQILQINVEKILGNLD